MIAVGAVIGAVALAHRPAVNQAAVATTGVQAARQLQRAALARFS